jgi:glucan 1,3-beta-glucosidase
MSIDGNRCGLGCKSTTTAPAIVYFPSGNYVVSAPIIRTWEISSCQSSFTYFHVAFYYTALVGNPKNRPTITAAASFTGMAVIGMFYKSLSTFLISNLVLDADPYIANGQYWVNQNVRTSTVHLDILVY